MAKIGIIGWGVVGQATGKGFKKNKKNKVFWYDKYKKSPYSQDDVVGQSEFIFICVPSPMFSDYSGLDLSIVDSVVDKIAPKISQTDKILVVKSTVLPGTTAGYIRRFPRADLATSPEFLTQRNANKDFLNPSRTIIGAEDRKVAERLKRVHKTILPANQPYFLTDPTSAELAKYMSNVMLASKTLLANEFYALAQKLKVDYDDIRVLVEADPRIGTHLKVPGPDKDLGFGGACFPKDLVGLLALGKELKVDLSALDAIWKKNLKIRKVRDWEEIEGAVSYKKKPSSKK